MRHDLKTWLDSFAAIVDGRKGFDIRKEGDRSFREGDGLYLREWNEFDEVYTGRAVETTVTYITRGPDWEIPAGMVVLSLGPTSELIEGTLPAVNSDPEITRELLVLAGVNARVERIREWTEEQRKQADEWASAMCLLTPPERYEISLKIPPHVSEAFTVSYRWTR